MTGVGSARIAHHDVGKLHVNIDDFAFALVAPLSTHNDHRRHIHSHGWYAARATWLYADPSGGRLNWLARASGSRRTDFLCWSATRKSDPLSFATSSTWL